MAGNGALDLSIRIMGKVDPSLVSAIKQTKGLTGDLSQALAGTKTLGSTVADTMGVIGKAGLGIMAALTASATVMVKKTTDMAEEYQAQAADAVKYVGGIMNDDGSIDPAKRAVLEDEILRMTTVVPIKRDEMAQIAASLGQSGKDYDQIFKDNAQTGEKSYLYDAARLAAAWDIDAQSAANYMAKWETAFNKTHTQIIDIADSINYLGGHMATTAAEIADVVNTSGGVGQTAGVDLHTTSALAATMLAMGVDTGKAGTSLNRVFTNITLGNSATAAQEAAWRSLGFDPVQIAKDMQATGPNGEDGAASTLYKVFEAVSKQDKYQQTATIKTLFGQWAIEGVSKIVGNLPAFQDALLMAGDASTYSGSMEKELLVKLSTSGAVSQMASNATDRLLINMGNQFLPAKKELTSMWIDIANGITESLPDLSNIVNGVLPLFRAAISGIGNAAKSALPWIQKGIDYTSEHGPEVAGAIAAIIAAFGAMSAAPTVYGTGSALMNAVSNIVIGGMASGAPGGTLGGIRVGNLIEMLSPTGLIQNAVSGVSSARSNIGAVVSGAQYGIQMAGTGSQPGTVTGKIQQTLSGAGVGIWAALKNAKGLNSGTKKGQLGFVSDALNATTSGGLSGLLQNTAAGKYISGVGRSLSGLKNAVMNFGTNTPLGRFMAKTGSVTGEILSGIVGPEGMDIGGLVSGVGSFLGAGGSVIGNGLSGAWKSVSNSKVGSAVLGAGGKVAKTAASIGGGALSSAAGILDIGGAGLNLLGTTVGPVASKLGGGFMSLLGMFGPSITALGTMVAVVSILGDHFEDIRGIVGTVFGEGGLAVFDKFTGKISGIGETAKQVFAQLSTPEGLQSIQERLSGVNVLGFDLGDVFGAAMPAIQTAMPLIQSFAGVFSQIVDLGVNHIKPVLIEIFGFIANEGIPAVIPLLSTVVSLVGTTLVNAIKVAVDVIGKVAPIVEPVILGIIDFLKQVANVGVKVVNFIIGALNKIQIKIPETLFGIPIPIVGGKTFGFNLSPVSMPAFANGGMTQGPSIAGEAGPEAVISFRRGVREKNLDTWLTAGKMLGVGIGDLQKLFGGKPRMFADGGFTDDSNLIDFRKAQRQQYYNRIAQSASTEFPSVVASMVLGSDIGVAFGRITDFANYAVDGLEALAAVSPPEVSGDQSQLQQIVNGSIGKIVSGAQSVLENQNAQKMIQFIRGADLEKAKLEYESNPDNYDLSNVSFYPTYDPEATRRSISALNDLQNYWQNVVELPSVGGGSDGGSRREGGGAGYRRNYTSSSGNTYVYSPNITVYGDMTPDDLRTILDEGYERFCENMERYEREMRRKNYGT